MAKNVEISTDNFENLLDWLHIDREVAGQEYESIRNGLIRIFYARGCFNAEELADETIDRVAGKVEKISETYQGKRSLYFYAVAKKVFLEYSRKPKLKELPANLVEETADETSEVYYECLDKCLTKIPSDQRQLVVEYYQGERQAKITQRKLIESRLGISNQALRVRVLRLRSILQKCVINCVQKSFIETF